MTCCFMFCVLFFLFCVVYFVLCCFVCFVSVCFALFLSCFFFPRLSTASLVRREVDQASPPRPPPHSPRYYQLLLHPQPAARHLFTSRYCRRVPLKRHPVFFFSNPNPVALVPPAYPPLPKHACRFFLTRINFASCWLVRRGHSSTFIREWRRFKSNGGIGYPVGSDLSLSLRRSWTLWWRSRAGF